MEIAWIYYGFCGAISNFVVWISLLFPSECHFAISTVLALTGAKTDHKGYFDTSMAVLAPILNAILALIFSAVLAPIHNAVLARVFSAVLAPYLVLFWSPYLGAVLAPILSTVLALILSAVLAKYRAKLGC
jgi:hypothetical protein